MSRFRDRLVSGPAAPAARRRRRATPGTTLANPTCSLASAAAAADGYRVTLSIVI